VVPENICNYPKEGFGSSNGEGSLEFPDRCGVYNQKILP